MVEAPAAVEDALASLLVHPDQSLQAPPTPPDLLCRQHCRFAPLSQLSYTSLTILLCTVEDGSGQRVVLLRRTASSDSLFQPACLALCRDQGHV